MDALHEQIEHAVHTLFSHANDPSFDVAASAVFTSDFTSKCLDFRSGLISHLLQASGSKKERLIIHFYQRTTLSHLEKIDSELKKVKAKKGNYYLKALDAFRIHLEDIISYIQYNFPRHLDVHQLVPPASRKIVRLEFLDVFQNLKRDRFEIDDELWEIITIPALQLSGQFGELPLTFYRISYARNFYREINLLLNNGLQGVPFKALIRTLMRLNFNLPQFIHYLSIYIDCDVKKESGSQMQLLKLRSWERELEFQCWPNQDACFHNHPAVNVTLLSFIRHEIKYFEPGPGPELSSYLEEIVVKEPFFRTDLSVDELAALSYFLFETGVIYTKNKQEFFRMVASVFKTKNVGQISSNSFGKKFYEISPRTIEKIKDKLIEMINKTRSYND